MHVLVHFLSLLVFFSIYEVVEGEEFSGTSELIFDRVPLNAHTFLADNYLKYYTYVPK